MQFLVMAPNDGNQYSLKYISNLRIIGFKKCFNVVVLFAEMCIHKIGNRTIFSEMHAAN